MGQADPRAPSCLLVPPYRFTCILTLSTQLTGFALAGISRRFVVWPASLIWPQNLVACTLLNTLHAEDEEGSTGMTRYRFFVIATGIAGVWAFFPCESNRFWRLVASALPNYLHSG